MKNERKKILLIDDEIYWDSSFIKALLDSNIEVQVNRDFKAELNHLNKYDLLVFDSFYATEVFKDEIDRVKKSHPNIPFIFVSAHYDIDDALNSFRHGAWYYLRKDI